MSISKQKKLYLLILFTLVPTAAYCFLLMTRFNSYLCTTIAKLVLFAAFPSVYFYISKENFRDVFIFRGKGRCLKISFLIAAGAALVIILGFIALRSLFDDKMILDSLKKEGITGSNFVFVFMNIIFVNAFLEEVFFRGFAFLTVYRLGFKKFSYIFSSVMFALYHTTMILNWFSPLIFIVCIIGLTAAGLIFNEIDRRCENIYGSYIVHVGANVGINLIAVYLFLNN